MTRRVFSLSFAALFFLTVALSIPVAARPYIEAHRHYKSGLAKIGLNEYQAGMVELRKSLTWRSPFNTAAEQSSRELYTIATSPSDNALSAKASEELWRGLQSSRSWYFSIPGLWRGVSEINAKKLLAEKFPPPSNSIQETYPPQVFFSWQWIVHLSLISWVSLIFITIAKNFSEDGRLRIGVRGTFFLQLGALLMSWLIWLVALTRA